MDDPSRQSLLRSLPAVDEILNQAPIQELLKVVPRTLVLHTIREELEGRRREILSSSATAACLSEQSAEHLIRRIADQAKAKSRFSLCKVINATGIVIHTNLGRAPVSSRVLEHLATIARGYCNLEFDLEKGERGSRYRHVEQVLCELSGAESAMVVNNNAAAVLVALNTVATSREVVVSRGELIEIGGSFRLPDVMRQSGCILREVGATNRTRISDYEQAISSETALFLSAHPSNYRIMGFSQQVPLPELAALGRKAGIPVLRDLGSGSFVDLSPYGLREEPTVRETVATGVEIVTFSGDKLLGGPQAGIILGEKQYLDAIKRNPLLRALRVDKFTLAALEAVLQEYRDQDRAMRSLPVLAMLTCPWEEIRKKAATLLRQLRKRVAERYELAVADDFSLAGGGSLPLEQLPTRVVMVKPRAFSVTELDARLRRGDPPVVARVSQDRLLIDVRTVFPEEVPMIVAALEQAG